MRARRTSRCRCPQEPIALLSSAAGRVTRWQRGRSRSSALREAGQGGVGVDAAEAHVARAPDRRAARRPSCARPAPARTRRRCVRRPALRGAHPEERYRLRTKAVLRAPHPVALRRATMRPAALVDGAVTSGSAWKRASTHVAGSGSPSVRAASVTYEGQGVAQRDRAPWRVCGVDGWPARHADGAGRPWRRAAPPAAIAPPRRRSVQRQRARGRQLAQITPGVGDAAERAIVLAGDPTARSRVRGGHDPDRRLHAVTGRSRRRAGASTSQTLLERRGSAFLRAPRRRLVEYAGWSSIADLIGHARSASGRARHACARVGCTRSPRSEPTAATPSCGWAVAERPAERRTGTGERCARARTAPARIGRDARGTSRKFGAARSNCWRAGRTCCCVVGQARAVRMRSVTSSTSPRPSTSTSRPRSR